MICLKINSVPVALFMLHPVGKKGWKFYDLENKKLYCLEMWSLSRENFHLSKSENPPANSYGFQALYDFGERVGNSGETIKDLGTRQVQQV